MATAVQKRKKKPTHRYYRAEFSARPDPEVMERRRVALGFPDGGEWLQADGLIVHRAVGRRAYEAIWAVPIKPAASSGVCRG